MSAKFDVSAALKVADTLRAAPKRLEQVRVRAVATLARSLPPEANRQIREIYNVKARSVAERLNVVRADDSIVLTGYARAMGFLNYGARATKKSGVSVTVRRATGPSRFNHAFKAVGLSDNTHIFVRDIDKPKRVMKRGKSAGKKRQPIKALYGPSVASALRNPDIRNRLSDFGMTKLAAEVARQFKVL